MTADQHRKSRRHYSYEFEYKVGAGQAKWEARVNDGSVRTDLEGTFKVSTMGPHDTFEQRVVDEIHRAMDAIKN